MNKWDLSLYSEDSFSSNFHNTENIGKAQARKNQYTDKSYQKTPRLYAWFSSLKCNSHHFQFILQIWLDSELHVHRYRALGLYFDDVKSGMKSDTRENFVKCQHINHLLRSSTRLLLRKVWKKGLNNHMRLFQGITRWFEAVSAVRIRSTLEPKPKKHSEVLAGVGFRSWLYVIKIQSQSSVSR